jgi:hypothetical protein
MLKKYLKYTLITLLLLTAAAIVIDKYAKQEYLNFLARYYFDEKYYLAEYPEVKDSGMSPFEHYTQIGWKENKNPNAEFNNKLYRSLYFNYGNKYNLTPLADYVYNKIKFRNRTIDISKLKKITPLENPKYYLSLVAIFRDEARFLKEWIEFYRMIGVEHFYLYNHLGTDNYQEVLQPYIDQGIVELYNITEEPTNEKGWYKIQTGAYSDIVKASADKTEWLMMIDTDEFLFPVKEKSLANALKAYDQYAALSVNWKMFGSGGVQRIPDNKLLIETLLYKQDPQIVDLHVKTIVKPRYVRDDVINLNPHYPILKPGYYQITENFGYFSGPFAPEESRNIFRINHYWARDLEFFYKNKIHRLHVGLSKGLSSEAEVAKRTQDLLNINKSISTTYDDAILKYVPELRERVFGKESNNSNSKK